MNRNLEEEKSKNKNNENATWHWRVTGWPAFLSMVCSSAWLSAVLVATTWAQKILCGRFPKNIKTDQLSCFPIFLSNPIGGNTCVPGVITTNSNVISDKWVFPTNTKASPPRLFNCRWLPAQSAPKLMGWEFDVNAIIIIVVIFNIIPNIIATVATSVPSSLIHRTSGWGIPDAVHGNSTWFK